MNNSASLITNLAALEESGKGICFNVIDKKGEVIPAFVIRFDGQARAFLNRCGHIAVRLDYMPGQFFSDDGQTLVCSTHGAEYAPDTGACLGGPCFGIGLDPLAIDLDAGNLYLVGDDYRIAPAQDTSSES